MRSPAFDDRLLPALRNEECTGEVPFYELFVDDEVIRAIRGSS